MQRVTQPAVVVTRFEYANLFHTVTDWYSAYMTSRIAKLKKRPRLIFVDGHCKVKKLLHLTDYPHFSPSFYNIK